MKQLTTTDELNRDDWSVFVRNHHQGNILQTPEMFDIFDQTKNYTPIFIAVVDESKNVLGTMLSVIQSEFSSFLGKFTARAITWGGPLIKDENGLVLEIILKAYDKKVKHRVIYSQIRNFSKPSFEIQAFQSLDFKYEDHLNILVDLTKTKEQLWKEVKAARRKTINKAKRLGVTFRELVDSVEIIASYKIIEAVYKKAKLPLPDISLFQSAREILMPKKMVRFFGAFHEDILIGTRVVLCYKDYIFDWYAGSYQQYYSLRPNDLLPWEVFLWGKDNGFDTFDFGGAGSPHTPYGVRDYKMKFCSDTIDTGRFQKVHKPLLMAFGKIALTVYKKIR